MLLQGKHMHNLKESFPRVLIRIKWQARNKKTMGTSMSIQVGGLLKRDLWNEYQKNFNYVNGHTVLTKDIYIEE